MSTLPAALVPRETARGAYAFALSQAGPSFYLALGVIALVLFAAMVPHVLAPADPYGIDPAHAFAPPSSTYWFGTDQSGRDTFSRVVHGTRVSLAVGVLAISIALVIGAALGIGAIMGGKWVDLAVNRLIDVFYAFPGLILALIVIAILGPSALTVAVSVGVGSAAGYARIIRAQALLVFRSDYVMAARALGHPARWILLRTIIPNISRPLLPLFTLGVGQTIVWATGLSFLGLGVQPPRAEWGALLADSRNYTALAWWLTVFPGATIAATGLALTVVGRHLESTFGGGRGR
jgi:peptide/nickel transport system permease protein